MRQAALFAVFIAIISFGLTLPVKGNYRSGINPPGDTSLMKISSIQNMLQEIIDATGLNTDFEIKEANVLNIEASISHRKRYILYNPTYISTLNNLTKSKWAVMTLLAHEVGHHLNGHTMHKGGSNPSVELEADEFAGFILYKLGATLGESQLVMHYIAKTKKSRTHPARDSRLLAIEKGWNKASDLEQAKYTVQQ